MPNWRGGGMLNAKDRGRLDSGSEVAQAVHVSFWECNMKLRRDLDFVRELLLRMEGGETTFNTLSGGEAAALGLGPEEASSEDPDKLKYHLDLMEEAGLIDIMFRSAGGSIIVESITWAGHDFLDSVRDPAIWKATKAGAEGLGLAGFDPIKALAKGLVKKKIEQHTGIEIDL